MTAANNRRFALILAVGLAGLALVPTDVVLHWFRLLNPTPLQRQGAQVLRVMGLVSAAYILVGVRNAWWSAPAEATMADRLAPAERWGLAGLLGATLALRLWALGDGLWVDEVSTLVNYVRRPLGEIIATYDSNNQHALFSVLAHLSVGVFGESAWALRLPAAIFGTLTVLALYFLARNLLGQRIAWWTATLLAVSYQAIWFSQNARGYSGLLFFSVASTHFLVRGLQNSRDGRQWLGYALMVGLGMYVHLTMLFVVAGQLAAYAAAWRSLPGGMRWRPLAAGFVASGVCTLLLYAPLLPQIPGASARDTSTVAVWRSPVWLLRETLGGLGLGSSMLVAAVLGVAFLGTGLARLWRVAPSVVTTAVVSVVAGGLSMLALGHHLWPRFFIYAAGFGILILVVSIDVVGSWLGGRLALAPGRVWLLPTAGCTLLLLLMLRTLPQVYGPKQDYAGVRDFVVASMTAGDTVASVGVARVALRDYYAPGWATVDNADELRALASSHPRTWLVYTLPAEMEDNHPDVLAELAHGWRHVRTFPGTLRGGDLLVYRREPPATSGGT